MIFVSQKAKFIWVKTKIILAMSYLDIQKRRKIKILWYIYVSPKCLSRPSKKTCRPTYEDIHLLLIKDIYRSYDPLQRTPSKKAYIWKKYTKSEATYVEDMQNLKLHTFVEDREI